MQTQLSKAEKVIAEMRDAYAKTKADSEQTINSRDEEIAKLTKKIAELTLALKQANDNVDELQKTLAEYEVVSFERTCRLVFDESCVKGRRGRRGSGRRGRQS